MAKKSYGGDTTKTVRVTVAPYKKETDEQKERRMANKPMSNDDKIKKHGMAKIMASPTLPSVAYEQDLLKRKNKKQ